MIIIKVEKPGGLWEYHEFDTTRGIAAFLLKNPELKLRLVARTDVGEMAKSINDWKIKLKK